MKRKTSRLAAALVALVVVMTPGLNDAATTRGPKALTVLPPGNGSTITMPAYIKNQITGDCADLGAHVCDQLDLYKNWGFKNGDLSPDADHVAGAVSEEDPIPGVRIVHDNMGVPHVFATGSNEQQIEERLGYGIGFAQAEDRLFQMEIFRRAGEGRVAELLGTDYLEMDTVLRRDVETAAERAQQIKKMLTPGEQLSLQRYADGINAVIQRDMNDPSTMPAGFLLTQDLPLAPWTVEDSIAIQILETKAVAESSGNELGYGGLAQLLAKRYGVAKAVAILNDVQLTHDPLTPVSVPHGQRAHITTDRMHYSFIDYTRADTAALIKGLPPGLAAADHEVLTGDQAIADATTSLGLPHFGSNAWAIAPSKSANGHAMLWGAPQVSYYVPPPLQEMEIVGGLTDARGVGVPGAGPGLVIGYNRHVAWSLTSSQDDQVDTYIDRVRRSGTGYQFWYRGAWRPVQQRTEQISVRSTTPASTPAVGEVPLPVETTHTVTFYRTMHGGIPCIVSSIAGNVAYCKVRAFWNTELGTGLAVVGAAQATGLRQFDAAVRHSVAGFNFIYADDAGHIAYWHTGTIPIRARGHDPRLPVPGDGRFDWRGFLSPRLWPSVVDPAQGWVANWNNKPAFNWPDAGDGTIWGTTQRVGEPMMLLRASGKLTYAGLWHVARTTGQTDLRATLGFKRLLTSLHGLTPLERNVVGIVNAWNGSAFYPGGACGAQVCSPAFPIMEAWFKALEARAGAAVFGPALGNKPVADAVRAFTRTPGTTSPEFEFFDDYDQFLFDMLSGRAHGAAYIASVPRLVRAALDDAIALLTKQQGSDPTKWRAPMPQITFQELDVGAVGTIPWENRGTWGQAVELP